MERAAARFVDAVKASERIAVFAITMWTAPAPPRCWSGM
jgi:hypothetical protein